MKSRAIFAWTLGFMLVLAIPAAASSAGEPGVLDRDARGIPTFVAGGIGTLPAGDRGRAATAVLSALVQRSFQARGSEEFAVRRVREDEFGNLHVRVQQRLNGLPVVGAELILHANASGEVYAVNGRFVPDDGLPRDPALAAEKALAAAYVEAGILHPAVIQGPALTYVADPVAGGAHLAWSALVRYEDDGERLDRVFADARTGALVARHPLVHDVRDRETYDADNGTTLPGTLVIQETGSSTDQTLQNIHDNTGRTYDYYANRFGRDSLDDAGRRLISTGHYGSSYNNAFWNGTQMVYGDGDDTKFSPLGNALDVVAHELTHGVTDFESDLVYSNESGAMNESLSDIFAAAAEAWVDGSVSADTWKIGEDVYTPTAAGDALRYMDYPTRDGSSRDYYPERYTGSDDNGGVHWNSGIGNLAFQRLVAGGYHPRGKNHYYVPGIGMARAEAIFYRAQTVYLTSTGDFAAARQTTLQAASDLYGAGSSERAAVRMAWCMAGVFGNRDCPFDLTGSGYTFAGRRFADLYWINGQGTNVDVFRDGVRVATVANNGAYTNWFYSSSTSANYWVCTAGSTTYYNSTTCSNVTTVYF